MTHTLHRMGINDDLKEDYVVLACLAKGFNRETPQGRENVIRVAEILNQQDPINMIPEFTWKISPVVTAVYNDLESVKEIVKTLKEEDLGISIVISGLISEVKKALDELNMGMHTVHLSLGVFGKKELLPKEKLLLEATTMCGHHCISPQSVLHYVDLIKKGKVTLERAAEKLSKPCVCGIFNIKRATTILNRILD